MRILFHSNAPWCNTGYGKQTAIFTPLLRDLGHDVAISAFHGLHGGPTEWQGMPVYPGGRDSWGMEIIRDHAAHWKADLIITLMDAWVMDATVLKDLKLAAWTPIDCKPLGAADRYCLEASEAIVIAVSRHGERMLGEAGLNPHYVPHGIDTTVFQPPADRAELRREMGLDGHFAIGINAANTDHSRKGFPEQFRAFSALHRDKPEAILLVHSAAENLNYGGLDLRRLAAECGVEKSVVFCDQYSYHAGLFPDEALARWYGALDVLSNCSWGEGFGLPIIEAQACGTPVIVTNASSMPGLRGNGWQVEAEPFWNFLHQAWWAKPRVTEIERAYERAMLDAASRRKTARNFALGYEAKTIAQDYWRPVLERIAST